MAGGSAQALTEMLHQASIQASLQLQSSERDPAGVFVRIHSTVVFAAASDWNEERVRSAINQYVGSNLTAGQLGVSWQPTGGYHRLDGLWPLSISVRGKYLLVSDDPALLDSVLAMFTHQTNRKPLEYLAGFNHSRERENFARFTGLIDRPNAVLAGSPASERQPQFFSGNMVSLSATLAGVSSEQIEIRSDGIKLRQMVTYQWSP